MSHYAIICKVKADSEEDALDYVRTELDETTGEGNRGGFDYVSEDMEVLTEEKIKSQGFQSFEEFEDKWFRQDHETEIKQNLGLIQDEVRLLLAEKHLSQRELPLLMGDAAQNWVGRTDEQFKELIESRLKSGRDGTLPKNFPQLLDAVMGLITSLCVTEGHSMITYLMKKIQQIKECDFYPKEKYYILNTLDNHFADLTDDTEGENIYYVFADRHS